MQRPIQAFWSKSPRYRALGLLFAGHCLALGNGCQGVRLKGSNGSSGGPDATGTKTQQPGKTGKKGPGEVQSGQSSEDPRRCGNKEVEEGEECDDGNTDDNDACLSSCKRARCGDGKLWKGQEECDDGNKSSQDGCVAGCKIARCGDGFIQDKKEECDDGGPKGASKKGSFCLKNCKLNICGDSNPGGRGESCDDGNKKNDDQCTTACRRPKCGNGKVDKDEECDDGNLDNGDACLSNCKEAQCGDGFVQRGEEACDDGNPSNQDECLNSCKLPYCGDGYVRSGAEECDDKNNSDHDDCRNNCTLARCGDGVVHNEGDGKEACDDGNDSNLDLCLNNCQENTCGDGIVGGEGEQCDPYGDSKECSDNCTLSSCGDSELQAPEQCDDGAEDNKGSCTQNCREAICGDGFVHEDAEECDGETQRDCKDEFGGKVYNPDQAVLCSNCKLAVEACLRCGDGQIHPNFGEACDGEMKCDDPRLPDWVYHREGASVKCSKDCKELDAKPCGYCGDSEVQREFEQCDDGNDNETDKCAACQKATCGDGFVQKGKEDCDDGNEDNSDACVKCQPAACGDGFVWKGHEACDYNDDKNRIEKLSCERICGERSEPKQPGGMAQRECKSDDNPCTWGPWRCHDFCKPPGAGSSPTPSQAFDER